MNPDKEWRDLEAYLRSQGKVIVEYKQTTAERISVLMAQQDEAFQRFMRRVMG